LDLNFLLAADAASEKGVPSAEPLNPDEPSPAARPVLDYENDEDIRNLKLAAGGGDADEIAAVLPKGVVKVQNHLQFLDNKWRAAVDQGEVTYKKVVKLADILMIAISIYQVSKIPVVEGGGTPPPVVVGALPGGVAITSQFSAISIATALESIRRLVAIGAL